MRSFKTAAKINSKSLGSSDPKAWSLRVQFPYQKLVLRNQRGRQAQQHPDFGKGPVGLHMNTTPSRFHGQDSAVQCSPAACGRAQKGPRAFKYLPPKSLVIPLLLFESSWSLLQVHLHNHPPTENISCAPRACSWLWLRLISRGTTEAAGPGQPWSWYCNPRSGTFPKRSASRGRCKRASLTSWGGGEEQFSGDRTCDSNPSIKIKKPSKLYSHHITPPPPRKLQILSDFCSRSLTAAGRDMQSWQLQPLEHTTSHMKAQRGAIWCLLLSILHFTQLCQLSWIKSWHSEPGWGACQEGFSSCTLDLLWQQFPFESGAEQRTTYLMKITMLCTFTLGNVQKKLEESKTKKYVSTG